MRVSTGQLQRYVLQGLNDQGLRYAEATRQMVTGERILRPSDDPLGTVTLLSLEREQQALNQYRANIGTVGSRLAKAQTYLQSSVDVLLRVQDLALAAVNGSHSETDRSAAALELINLRTTLLDLANARGEGGDYLFAGSRVDTIPVVTDASGNYIYQGDDLVRQVNVANGVAIASNDTAAAIFFDADGVGNLFADLSSFIEALTTPGADIAVAGGVMLGRFNKTLDAVNYTLTDLGGRLNTLEQLDLAQQDLALVNEKTIGEIRDLDYADVMMRISQIELALGATQKSYATINQLTLFDYL
ncbi:MAG: flagellar hook-associated protein FlgL [Spongiibacteraceae bacterium]|jgi:flagellar hook-associated protein 3 FlgL|nr:flagellar hook-associated protein FlgL [Spongiibacteraceae bacterium]